MQQVIVCVVLHGTRLNSEVQHDCTHTIPTVSRKVGKCLSAAHRHSLSQDCPDKNSEKGLQSFCRDLPKLDDHAFLPRVLPRRLKQD